MEVVLHKNVVFHALIEIDILDIWITCDLS